MSQLRRAQIYAACDRLLKRLLRGVDIFHQAVWLGFLDDAQLDAAVAIHYSRWPNYRDDSYNLSGLHQWEEQAISKYFPAGGSILVAGAGGGREPIALGRKGHRVDGFDSSSELIEIYKRLKKKEGLPGKIYFAPAGSVPDDIGDAYDCILVGWGAYGHIPNRTSRISFLKALYKHAVPGGPLLLSFFTRGGSSKRYQLSYSVANPIRRLRRSLDQIEYGDILEDGAFCHVFTEDEISSELAEAGFELIEYLRLPFGHAVARSVEP